MIKISKRNAPYGFKNHAMERQITVCQDGLRIHSSLCGFVWFMQV
jgi:hypothetical protein